MSYTPTTNEDIILNISSKEIDLSTLIQRYQNLKAELQELPSRKDIPDDETLEIYNQWVDGVIENTNSRIVDLYNRIKPIKDAGLLPSKYDSKYAQLEQYINKL